MSRYRAMFFIAGCVVFIVLMLMIVPIYDIAFASSTNRVLKPLYDWVAVICGGIIVLAISVFCLRKFWNNEIGSADPVDVNAESNKKVADDV